MSPWARQLVVTVSVEPDDPSAVGRAGAYASLAGLGRFHELCRRYGVRPTYLLTWSAAGEKRCVDFVRSCAADAAEFGAHLHPEEVPPVADGEHDNHTLRPSEVEPERLRAKLAGLVERVAEAVGRRPTSYRSGFFDLTRAQVDALVELGVEADSSLGPLEKTREGYPFLRAPFAPYVVAPDDVCRPMNGRLPTADCRLPTSCPLVEVPMTSVFRRPFPRALHGAYLASPGCLRGALRRLGLAEIVRFRPATASADELLAVCGRTERLGLPAVMTLHSNELWPGTSAAVSTKAQRVAYFERLERVLAWTHERGWQSRTLTEVARDVRAPAAETPLPLRERMGEGRTNNQPSPCPSLRGRGGSGANP